MSKKSKEESTVAEPPGIVPPSSTAGNDGWADPTPTKTAIETSVEIKVTEPTDALPANEDWDLLPSVQRPGKELIIQEHAGRFDPSQAKILLYGESGTGKTRLAATFPAVIFADSDLGMSSVDQQVDRVEITDFTQLEQLQKFLAAGQHSYQTVVLDTLNEMQRLAMRATVEDFPQIRRSYEDLPSMSDYGKMLHDFEDVVRDFLGLPMRVVLISQVTSRQFDTDTVQPDLVGKKTARALARKMDIIGYIYKGTGGDNQTHVIASFDSSEFVTKDRSNRLPQTLTDPSWARISAYWK